MEDVEIPDVDSLIMMFLNIIRGASEVIVIVIEEALSDNRIKGSIQGMMDMMMITRDNHNSRITVMNKR